VYMCLDQSSRVFSCYSRTTLSPGLFSLVFLKLVFAEIFVDNMLGSAVSVAAAMMC